jgi:hypothetical protein
LFKYKILKYSIIIFFSIILLFLLRIFYKPLDVSFLNSDKINLKDYLGELNNINSEKILLDFDLLKNRVRLELGTIKLKKYNNISNINAGNVSATIRISDLIKKSIIIESINISDGNIDIENITLNTSRKFFFTDILNGFPVKHISLKNINLNLYKDESRIAVVNNINGKIQNKFENIILDNLSADYIEYHDSKYKSKFIINKLLVSNKYTDNYIIAIDSLNLINKKNLIGIQYFKNVKNISLTSIIANYNLDNKKLSLESDILVKDKIGKIHLNGFYNDNKITKTLVKINIQQSELFSLIDDEIINASKYKLKNFINLNFNGNIIFNIDNNKLSNIDLDVVAIKNRSQLQAETNIKNSDSLNITQVILKANYRNNKIKIKELKIDSLEGNVYLKGNVIDYGDKFDHYFNIALTNFKYSSLINIVKVLQLDINQYQDYTNVIKDSFIKNLVINVDSKEEGVKISLKEAFLKNTNLKLKKNIKLAIPEINIKSNSNNNIIINIKSCKVLNDRAFINFTKTIIILEKYSDLNDIKNNFKVTTNIDTKYNSFYKLISDLGLDVFKNAYIKNIDGHVKGLLNISTDKSLNDTNNILYDFSAHLNNFNFIEGSSNKNKFINFNNFNGDLFVDSSGAKIKGKAYINGSMSNVNVFLDNLNTLSIHINSDAKASAFNFLKEFNYLKSGTNKLKIIITKNLNSKDWAANIKSDVFSSYIDLNFINYKKPANTRGNLSATFYFSGNKLIKIQNLNFFTDNIIMKGSLYFDDNAKLKKIQLDEYIHKKNNFSATLTYSKNEDKIIKVVGSSIDLTDFMKSNNKKQKNLIFTLDIEKLFYGDQYLGESILNTQIKNGFLHNIKGELLYNSKPYVYFRDIVYQEKKFKKIFFKFDDLGLFLKEIDLSDSFIRGNGDVFLIIDNENLSIISGSIDISDSSIKNASFLARLLQLASFTGLLEILTNEGIPFNQIIGDFTVDDKVVDISSLKFKGFSLGGTVKGNINLNNEKINLEGVIVPAYAINSLINKIPIVGQIITGIEGEGLIGVNYKAKGTIDKPTYNINPLSILTPGIIRNIFDVFKVDESKPIK